MSTILAAISLPHGLTPADVAGYVRDGQLRVSSEGAVILVMRPSLRAYTQEVRNLSCPRIPGEVFALGVRILAVFGSGSGTRVKLWGRPAGDHRTGIWLWTAKGLSFRERLDDCTLLCRGPYEGAVPAGRNPSDPAGFLRYHFPGHSMLISDRALVHVCADGSVVTIDHANKRADWLFPFSPAPSRETRLTLPPIPGVFQYLRWKSVHLFMVRSGNGVVLWEAGRGFLNVTGGKEWQLEYAWGSPSGERLVLLYRKSSRKGMPLRRLVVTDGGSDSPSVSVLAEGNFRVPNAFGAVVWSAENDHPAVCVQRVVGVDPEQRPVYTSSIVTFFGHTLLPPGTRSATCVVSQEGGVMGALARLEATNVVLIPGQPEMTFPEAWGLRVQDGHLVWEAVHTSPDKPATLVRMTTASRPVHSFAAVA